MLKQKELINKYGYKDENGRQSLYCTISNKKPNAQGFFLKSISKKNIIVLKHIDIGYNFAEWSTYVLVEKFMTKMDRMILGFAETKEIEGKEHFHFVDAILLEHPIPEKFLEAFKNNEMLIDLRMHLKESGIVRNHGTGFRISEKNLQLLYSKKKKLL